MLLEILKKHFEANMHRHHGLNWVDIEDQLKQKSENLWSLKQMEETGEEPDIVSFGSKSSETIVKLLYYSYRIRKKLEITHRLSRSTILYAYV